MTKVSLTSDEEKEFIISKLMECYRQGIEPAYELLDGARRNHISAQWIKQYIEEYEQNGQL